MWVSLDIVLNSFQSNQSPARQTVPTVWETVGTACKMGRPFDSAAQPLERSESGLGHFGLTVPTVSQTVPTVRAFSAQF